MTELKTAKPETKSPTDKAAFRWDPNADQTYNLDQDLGLTGTAGDFNKNIPYSFTMDAPGRTLVLFPSAQQPNITIWGGGTPPGDIAATPSIFEIRNGTLTYDAGQAVTLILGAEGSGSEGLDATKFTVRNTAKFIAQGPGMIWAPQNLELRIQDSGSVSMTGKNIQLDGWDVSTASIALVDKAQMSLVASGQAWLETLPVTVAGNAQMSIKGQIVQFGGGPGSGALNVSSAPDASPAGGGYSLDSISATTTVNLSKNMYFSANSRSRLRTPTLQMEDALIETSDSAEFYLQFDEFQTPQNLTPVRFVLGPDNAVFRFDGYSVEDPFDFRNKTYPQGLFEIRTGTTTTAYDSEFVIKNPGAAFAFTAALNKGLISIDNQLQANRDRLNVTFDAQGYTHIKLKK